MRVRTLLTTALVAVLLAAGAPAVAATAATAPPPGGVPAASATGTYYPTGPTRVLDTRSGLSARGRVPAGGTVRLVPNTGRSTASAVVLNLTVVDPAAPGYLTAFPTGRPRPATASVNVGVGRPTANLVTVPVGAGGAIDLYNGAGTTDLVADLLGFFAADNSPIDVAGGTRGGGYHPTTPDRLLDTRTAGTGPLPAANYASLTVRYDGSGATIGAVAVTVTVTNPRAAGYVTAWNAAGSTPPAASTLNFAAGQTVGNAAIVPTTRCRTAACGGDAARFGIYNGSGGPLDLVVDITGYFDDGTGAAPVRYFPLARPVRVVDSRSGRGFITLDPATTRAFTPPAAVAGATTVALDANVGLVAPTAATYLTLWPRVGGTRRPVTSVVNAPAGQVVSTHAIVQVGAGNRVAVYNAAGRADVVVDVSGTFENVATGAAAGPVAPARLTALPGPTMLPSTARP